MSKPAKASRARGKVQREALILANEQNIQKLACAAERDPSLELGPALQQEAKFDEQSR